MRLESRDTTAKPYDGDGAVLKPLPPDTPGAVKTGTAGPVKTGKSGAAGKTGLLEPAVPRPNVFTPAKNFGPGHPQVSAKLIRPGTEALSRLAEPLGLPQDGLSAALLSFVRFFSLPLEPALLLKIRREVLALKEPREAAVLAAVAAADKGVELSAEALETYRAAIEAENTPGDGPEDGTAGQDGAAPEEAPAGQDGAAGEEGSAPETAGPSRERGAAGEDRGSFPPGFRTILERFKTPETGGPLPNFLNKLPGKDRRRWMVFPFIFRSGGVEFRVSIRITLNDNKNQVTRLAVDIHNDTRCWLFIMDSGKGEEEIRLSVFPPLEKLSSGALAEELGEFLGRPGASVRVSYEPVSQFEDCRDEVLLSINEEV
jgi:hypothetical protein